jgi:acyl-coenzyme A synthetase/AMP-(fatty) acid ligase
MPEDRGGTPATVAALLARAEAEARRGRADGGEADGLRPRLERGARLAAGLAARGLVAGDLVLQVLSRDDRRLELLVACARLGLVLAPLDPRRGLEELRRLAADLAPRLVVSAADLGGGAQRLDPARWEELLAAEPAPAREVAPEDPALLLHDAGVEGRPRAHPFTQGEVVAHAAAAARALRLRRGDRLALLSPGGVREAPWPLLAPLGAGAEPLFLPADGGRGRLAALAATGASHALLGVEQVGELLAVPAGRGAELPRLRALLVEGPWPAPELRERLEGLADGRLALVWGDATTLGLALVDGRPLPGMVARVVDPAGREVPDDGRAAGELRLRAPWLGDGPRDEERPGGLRSSGALAVRHPEGALEVRGGALDRVDPGPAGAAQRAVLTWEVEAALLTHQLVRECAALGLPQPGGGERLAVAVVRGGERELGLPELVAHLRLFLDPARMPRVVHFVEALPRAVDGRVRKRLLRELLLDRPGEEVAA